MRTVAFCEIEPFARRVLRKHWPEVPIHDDIRKLTGDRIAPNVICGGYPCQPFSTASRGRRIATDLWPEMLRLIDRCSPAYVIVENVQEAAISNAASDLRVLGYRTYQRRISAADCGADHQRNRWWLVAYPDSKSELHRALDAEVAKLPEICRDLWGAANYAGAVRVSSRLSRRMDRSRIEALGNAVLPQITEAIGMAILAAEMANA